MRAPKTNMGRKGEEKNEFCTHQGRINRSLWVIWCYGVGREVYSLHGIMQSYLKYTIAFL